MVGAQVKKLKVSQETDDGDVSDQNDAELVLSIEKLQDIQDELDKVNEEASEKVLEVEQKYNEIRKPVYDKRNEIIKHIPHFWMTSFLSHPALAALLSEEDSKILKFLDSVDVEDFKDMKSGYSITFHFKENPYFEDVKLTKTFTFLDEGVTHITGTNIKWKEGMVMGAATNGVNHEEKGNKRAFSDDSFFSWFGENQETDIMEGLTVTDEVAEIIKEDLWPNPLKYFHTDADEVEDDDDEDDQQDDDEEEEDDSE